MERARHSNEIGDVENVTRRDRAIVPRWFSDLGVDAHFNATYFVRQIRIPK